jgi:hypothetical protein
MLCDLSLLILFMMKLCELVNFLTTLFVADDGSLDYLHFRPETDGRLNDFLRFYISEEKQALDITQNINFHSPKNNSLKIFFFFVWVCDFFVWIS